MRALAALLALLPTLAAAHPHAGVAQQLHLALGRDGAILRWILAPSEGEGAHLFDHLDLDGDGRIDTGERQAFADDLMGHTDFTVDGAPVALRLQEGAVPSRDEVAGAGAPIEIRAAADLALDPATAHRVTLDIDHRFFAEGWFVQPFYYPDLTGGAPPALERAPGGDGVTIRIAPAAE